MKISEVKKPNRYLTLTAYLIAVVCLLLGLFLPLFNGKNLLALQLPKAFNAMLGKDILTFGKDFTLNYRISLFGMANLSFDLMAVVVLLYALVTVFALLALIPVGFSTKHDTRTAIVFSYIIEVAASLVLSVYVVLALQLYPVTTISYNMLIALGGSLLPLIIICCADRRGAGAAKLFLFLFSAISLLLLFDLTIIIPKLAEPLNTLGTKIKMFPYFYSQEVEGVVVGGDGLRYLKFLLEGLAVPAEEGTAVMSYTDIIKELPDAKNKAAAVLCTIVAGVAVFNYFVDLISLSTRAKKVGYVFNIIRYSLELAAIIALYITLLVMKVNIGLFLVIVSVLCVIQLAISIIRCLLYSKKAVSEKTVKVKPRKKAKKESDDNGELEQLRIVRKPEAQQKPAVAEQLAFIDPPPRPAPEPVVMEEPEVRNDGGEQLTINDDAKSRKPETEQSAPVSEPAQPVKEAPPVYEAPVRKVEAQPEPAPAPAPVQEAPVREPEYRAPEPQREYKPVTPTPVRQEPVAPANAEPRVYTINTIYGGPTDDFLKKLSNDEKIEFARTFIERSNGPVGNIPDYVVGGNNKKFFSAVFIYLGRIRGMISDGLLNKMYKELNMM